MQVDISDDERDSKRHDTMSARHLETHEIGCNVGRDGELILNTGNHRLAIAKILEIERIPVKIIVRHEQWQRMRAEIADAPDPADITRELDVEPTHPDLIGIA